MVSSGSSESPLLFLPTEILLEVFQGCHSLRDVLALGATCKDTWRLFNLYAGPILDKFARKTFTAFDEAIVAVRAKILLERSPAYTIDIPSMLDGSSKPMPPKVLHLRSCDINLSELTAKYSKATLRELHEIHKMEQLWDCVQAMIFYDRTYLFEETGFNYDHPSDRLRGMYMYPRPGHPGGQLCVTEHDLKRYVIRNIFFYGGGGSLGSIDLEEPTEAALDELVGEIWPESQNGGNSWKQRFYAGLYKVVATGAYLAKFYIEPFLTDGEIQNAYATSFCHNGRVLGSQSRGKPPMYSERRALSSFLGLFSGFRTQPNKDQRVHATEDDQRFFSRFLVYDAVGTTKPVSKERISTFGPIVRYWTHPGVSGLDTTEDLISSLPSNDPIERLIVYFAYQTLLEVFWNADGKERLQRPNGCRYSRSYFRFEGHRYVDYNRVTIVIPGIFQPEVILTSKAEVQKPTGWLVAQNAGCEDDQCNIEHGTLDFSALFDHVFKYRLGQMSRRRLGLGPLWIKPLTNMMLGY